MQQRTIDVPESATFGELRDLGKYLESAGAEQVKVVLKDNVIPRQITWLGGPSVEEAQNQHPRFRG